MIYTSYFAKYKGENGISIARYSPKWWNGDVYKDLAPNDDLLFWWKSLSKIQQSNIEYINMYMMSYINNILNKLDVHKVAKDLDGKVLLCYEKPNDFCHRHIIREWFNHNGYACEEWIGD